MNELLKQIEAAIEGQGLQWLVRSGHQLGYFANICTATTESNPAGDHNWKSFRGVGRTAESALRMAFAEYKRSLS